MRVFLLIALLASPAAAADERKTLYGTWGTAKQCAREPIKPGGTVLAQPFEISQDVLTQGEIWCRLSWSPVEVREDRLFTSAQALCGEDSILGYWLRLELHGDHLTLHWDFPLSNGPLARCSDT